MGMGRKMGPLMGIRRVVERVELIEPLMNTDRDAAVFGASFDHGLCGGLGWGLADLGFSFPPARRARRYLPWAIRSVFIGVHQWLNSEHLRKPNPVAEPGIVIGSRSIIKATVCESSSSLDDGRRMPPRRRTGCHPGLQTRRNMGSLECSLFGILRGVLATATDVRQWQCIDFPRLLEISHLMIRPWRFSSRLRTRPPQQPRGGTPATSSSRDDLSQSCEHVSGRNGTVLACIKALDAGGNFLLPCRRCSRIRF